MKKKKNNSLIKSFYHAFVGIKTSFLEETKIIIHFSIMTLVIILGIVLSINFTEWMTCLILFSLVISFEMVNTAIEITLDACIPEINISVKKAKDISAGAVLIAAIISAIIGLMIFLPKIIAIIK
ncbi:MAG: diacylglycerol kinase family protein [Bacilli bacterium]